MTASIIGHTGLIIAFAITINHFILYGVKAIKARSGSVSALVLQRHHLFFRLTSLAQAITIGICMLTLMIAYATSDFSVLNVVLNSHSLKPLLYKITGSWGNHEGSMLLWLFIVTLFGAFFSKTQMEHDLKEKTLLIQSVIIFLLLSFIIFTSNPFIAVFPVPKDGQGLNPLLQDFGLAFHPPLLYLGYVGFSIIFSLSCAILWQGRMGTEVTLILRKWSLLAWSFLTAGIGLGMWWAYYELGWGGFWFWDPVENASLMPWLSGTALLHSAIMAQKKGMMKKWTCFLGVLSFSLSLMGTFIVRSGIITSVHSFASSPERGVFILCMLMLITGGGLLLYSFRVHHIQENIKAPLISQVTALSVNNYLLCGILLIVVTGTLYPTFLEVLTNERIAVGAPYFNITIAPLVYVIAFLSPLAGFIGFSDLKRFKKIIASMIAFILGVGLTIWVFQSSFPPSAYALILLGIWMILGTICEFILKGGLQKPWRILKHDCAKIGAHAGMGIVMIGIAGTALLATEKTIMMVEKQTKNLGNQHFTLVSQNVIPEGNYFSDKVSIIHDETGDLYIPERRFYPVEKQTTTEADIKLSLINDIYVTIGTLQKDNRRLVNIRIHPLALFLWSGLALMCIGGTLRFVLAFLSRSARLN